MTKFKTIGVTLVCNLCGETFETTDGFISYIGDEDGSLIGMDAENSGWISIHEQDFCPGCYKTDKDNNYHIKDGRVYDSETEELLKGGEK